MDIGGLNSGYLDYIKNTAGGSKTDKMEQSLNKKYESASDEELMDVCKQFESYFLEQVFKEMVKTIPESEESSGSNGALIDYYKDNMIQELAAQSTQQNSLGLAQSLYEQLKRNIGME